MPKRKKPRKTTRTPASKSLSGDLAASNVPVLDKLPVGSAGNKTIMLGYIHPGEVRGEFATSVFVAGKANHEVVGILARQSGPRVAAARNVVVQEFLLTNAEWLLFVDSDMFWTQDDLRKVIDAAHPTQRPFVGGLCFADQGGQLFPTIYLRNPDTGQFHVALEFPRNQCVPVDGTGAAFKIVHRSVYERLLKNADGNPDFAWYQDTTFDGKDRGEDLTFCQRVRDLGIPIHVHTGADINHVKQRYLNLAEFERARQTQRFLITGTGRSGTGYISKLLAKVQLATGHEAVFNPGTLRELRSELAPQWDAYRGEASWMAAPFLGHPEIKPLPTVQLVRNPLDIVRSLVGMGFFKGGVHEPYLAYAEQTLGIKLREMDYTEAACTFIVKWTEMIEAHNLPRFRVEDLEDPNVFWEMLKVLLEGATPDKSKIIEAVATTPKNVNSRPRDESVTWDDVTPELRDLAKRWGYEVETG